jgi:long-chain-acyl-CoA dehydrogenase
MLGELNKGFIYLMNELPQERLLVADMALASAEACFEWTRTFVKDRKAFGAPLSNLQTIKHRLATIKTEVVIGRTFADNCIDLLNNKRLDNSTASMAKYWLTDLQGKVRCPRTALLCHGFVLSLPLTFLIIMQVADECVQMHGGAGYMWEYNVARAFADGRVARIYGGANEIMKELISRDIVK